MKHKHVGLLLLGGIIYATTFSQPTIVNQKALGGSFREEIGTIALTKDGGSIAGGSSASNKSGEKSQNSRGDFDYWVVKLDKSRAIEWDKTIGGAEDDELYALQQTSDGGYILGGYSISPKSGEKSQNSRGDFDYWIIKLDNLGNIQWDKTIGGNDYDALYSLQQTSDGGYILGGSSSSNKSGEKTGNSRGSDDYWIVKLDNLGRIQWDKTIGGSNYDDLSSLQQTSDGGYILGGTSASSKSGEKTENSRGADDYWVVKLDKSGNIQWNKTIGGTASDGLFSLQQTRDSGYILGGSSASPKSGEKTQSSRGEDDYWVVKLGKLGKFQWDKTIGGSASDELFSLQQTRDTGYILGGYSYSSKSGEKTENSRGSADYWIVKMNKRGDVQWDKTIGGNNYDRLSTIKETVKNSYVMGGVSESGISGDKTVAQRGVADSWLVWLKYNPPAALIAASFENENSVAASSKNKSNEFIVYPNPAKGILHIQTNGKTTVSLTNQSGKVLLMQIIEGNGIINISRLTPGIYYLKSNATGEVQKVLVAK